MARGPRGRRRGAARRDVHRRARRRPGQRRGRLRLRQVRAHRARHQRRRLPRPSALRRGGRLPRLHVVATGPDGGAVTYADLEARRHRRCSSASSPRTRARSSSCACARRSASTAPPCMPWPRSRPAASPSWAARSSRPRPAPSPRCCAPSAEGSGTDVVAAAGQALRDNAVVLVGERLATVPGALSAAAALAEATGARLAWVPRRAGERGALEAGALPTLLPGGRPARGRRGTRRGRLRLGRASPCPRHAGPRHGRHRRRSGVR